MVGLRRFGLLSLCTGSAIVFVAAGMPGHLLWDWVGIPLVVVFVCVFAPCLVFMGRFLGNFLDHFGKRK